ncbi:hypothetical protein THOG11_160049 [Vibrio harveyi]|nr:hypothetical protein THOG11_160049 [Vibrio harveyi]
MYSDYWGAAKLTSIQKSLKTPLKFGFFRYSLIRTASLITRFSILCNLVA